jgi:hypothetical protein
MCWLLLYRDEKRFALKRTMYMDIHFCCNQKAVKFRRALARPHDPSKAMPRGPRM